MIIIVVGGEGSKRWTPPCRADPFFRYQTSVKGGFSFGVQVSDQRRVHVKDTHSGKPSIP